MSGKYLTAFTNGVTKAGFKNIGNIAIDTNPGSGDYSIANFVGGVSDTDDSYKYVIITDTTTAGVVGRSTAENTGTASGNTPMFWVSSTKDDTGFLYLVNRLPARKGQTPFTDVLSATTWLRTNGYWSTYVTPLLSLDAANYTSGNWVDSIGGIQFTLYNSQSFSLSNGGYFNFSPTSSQYASSTASLPDLSHWSVGVWHYYEGTNSTGSPCIITEVHPGLTSNINYVLGNTSDSSSNLQTGYFLNYTGFHSSPDHNNYLTVPFQLTSGNWYYIVGTYDGSNINLYVNNILIDSVNDVGMPLSSNGGINLMKRWDVSEFWGGKLAKVDIYDGSLSVAKVSSIWNENKSRFLTSLAGSLLFGTGKYLSLSTGLLFGAGRFTVEGWFYNNVSLINAPIIGQYGSGVGALNLFFTSDTTIQSNRNSGGGGNFTYTMATPVTLNEWHYIIYNRNSNGITAVYIDGVRCITTNTDNLNYDSQSLTIGRNFGPTYWKGYLTNLRVTIGVSVYDSTRPIQIPPTKPLTSSANTKYLMLGGNITTDSSGTQTVTNNNAVTQDSDIKPF